MSDGMEKVEISRYGTVEANNPRGRPERPVADLYVRKDVTGRGPTHIVVRRAEWTEPVPEGTTGTTIHLEELPHLMRQLRILARDAGIELPEADDE